MSSSSCNSHSFFRNVQQFEVGQGFKRQYAKCFTPRISMQWHCWWTSEIETFWRQRKYRFLIDLIDWRVINLYTIINWCFKLNGIFLSNEIEFPFERPLNNNYQIMSIPMKITIEINKLLSLIPFIFSLFQWKCVSRNEIMEKMTITLIYIPERIYIHLLHLFQ